ncbi:hypothetical protein [Paenibacillus sp. y28]|uniref:hypothetical protein n=1 Tax=Paenibacillus sp. y28 TaxID=3129110 RepID=UPI00301ABDA6
MNIIWDFLQRYGLQFSAVFVLIGFGLMGGLLLRKAGQTLQVQQERDAYARAWRTMHGEQETLPNHAVYRYLLLHLTSVLPSIPKRQMIYRVHAFLLCSAVLGLFVGTKAVSVYIGWAGNVPFNSFTIWFPIVAGLFAAFLPFLLLHSVIQTMRVRLSHLLLEYVEEFERQYLAHHGSVMNALRGLLLQTNGTLQQLTAMIIHAIQRGNKPAFLTTLMLFEHQIASRFAQVFVVLLKEGVGISGLEGRKVEHPKDIRVGLRSLIDKMHLQAQVQAQDQPKKREMIQVGLMVFPTLYGASYMAGEFLMQKKHYYLYEIPSQMNVFIASILMAFLALSLNLILGKRKLDL